MNISDKKQIVWEKNYQYLVTIRIDSIQTISNYLRPNEYRCYLVNVIKLFSFVTDNEAQ